ncbi:MAG: site-specific integrase [Acutalibacteraceae bacterium]|nr:site-specific integrase [Acutalibacteraceae bacterium]
MARRGESIYKRKDGRWEARYVSEITIDGRKKYASVYADSYRAVKEKQQRYMMFPTKDISSFSNQLLSEFINRWLCYVKNRVKPSTYYKYEGLSRNHICNEIGNMPLRFITRTAVEGFTEKLRTKKLSAKTVNDILTVLNLVFDYAEKLYDINMPKITYVREERKEARVLSMKEQEKLTRYLLDNMDEFKMAVLLTLYTGLRIGELCALRWEDISGDCITVNKTMQRLKNQKGGTVVVTGTPKSDSSYRTIPFPKALGEIVEQYRKEGYVIRTARNPFCEPRTVQQRFKAITDRVNLENVTFHTLRHTFATRCIEAGFDSKTLSDILGHSDVKITLNRYVHSSIELKRKNMEKITLYI